MAGDQQVGEGVGEEPDANCTTGYRHAPSSLLLAADPTALLTTVWVVVGAAVAVAAAVGVAAGDGAAAADGAKRRDVARDVASDAAVVHMIVVRRTRSACTVQTMAGVDCNGQFEATNGSTGRKSWISLSEAGAPGSAVVDCHTMTEAAGSLHSGRTGTCIARLQT